MRTAILAALALTTLATPLAAQGVAGPQLTRKPIADKTDTSAPDAPVNGVVYLYGNQRCPTDASGNEIVVCERRSAAERYLSPKEVRDGTIKPEYQSFANRGKTILEAGQTGIGTCTNVGPGGGTGCFQQRANNWGTQKANEKKAEGRVP